MKKIAFFVIALLYFNIPCSLAAPITNQMIYQTTIGFTSNDHLYLEYDSPEDRVMGLQTIGNNLYLYTQNPIENQVRAIIGVRIHDFNAKTLGVNANFYIGAATIHSISDNCDGYASLILGSRLQELEVGINNTLSDSSYININYRLLEGREKKRNFGIGVISKW